MFLFDFLTLLILCCAYLFVHCCNVLKENRFVVESQKKRDLLHSNAAKLLVVNKFVHFLWLKIYWQILHVEKIQQKCVPSASVCLPFPTVYTQNKAHKPDLKCEETIMLKSRILPQLRKRQMYGIIRENSKFIKSTVHFNVPLSCDPFSTVEI